MTSVFEWVVFLTGLLGGKELYRRLFWTLCWGAGRVIAGQQERDVTDAEAFALGRTKVISTIINLAVLEFKKVEWAKIGAGLREIRENVHHVLWMAWRGVRRDVILLWNLPRTIIEMKRLKASESARMARLIAEHESQIGLGDNTAGKLVADNLEGLILQRDALGRDIAEGRYLKPELKAKINEHVAAQGFVRALTAGETITPQAQALLSPVLVTAKAKLWLIGAGVVAVLALTSYVQTKRVWALKDDVREVKSQAAAVVKSRDAYAASLAQRDARIENSTKICLSEIETARQSALAAEQKAARERARRIHEQRKTLDGGGAVPVSSILRELPFAAGGEPTPSGAADPGSPILPP